MHNQRYLMTYKHKQACCWAILTVLDTLFFPQTWTPSASKFNLSLYFDKYLIGNLKHTVVQDIDWIDKL